MVVRPTITNVTAPASTQLTVDTDLPIGNTQRVLLLLNENIGSNAAAYTFLAAPRSTDTNSLTIPIGGVKPGEYFVRLQVDGAESLLNLDPAGGDFGPRVTVP